MAKVIVFDRLHIDGPECVLSCRWWADWKEADVVAEFEAKAARNEAAWREHRAIINGREINIRVGPTQVWCHPGVRIVVDE